MFSQFFLVFIYYGKISMEVYKILMKACNEYLHELQLLKPLFGELKKHFINFR